MATERERWIAAYECRSQLIAAARRAGLTEQEAEDVASEAIIRAAGKTDLDLGRVRSWLKVVGANLASDTLRARPKTAFLIKLHNHARRGDDCIADVDELHEATWVADQIRALPPRQRTVLEQRAAGRTPQRIADSLGVPYKTVESLTSRARSHIRAVHASTLAVVACAVGAARKGVRGMAPTTAAALSAAVLLADSGTPATPITPARPGPATAAQIEPVPVADASGSLAMAPAARSEGAEPLTAPPPALHGSRPAVPAPRTQVLPPRHVAGISHTGVEQERSAGDQSLVESAVACAEQGIELSASHVGCKAGVRGPS